MKHSKLESNYVYTQHPEADSFLQYYEMYYNIQAQPNYSIQFVMLDIGR